MRWGGVGGLAWIGVGWVWVWSMKYMSDFQGSNPVFRPSELTGKRLRFFLYWTRKSWVCSIAIFSRTRKHAIMTLFAYYRGRSKVHFVCWRVAVSFLHYITNMQQGLIILLCSYTVSARSLRYDDWPSRPGPDSVVSDPGLDGTSLNRERIAQPCSTSCSLLVSVISSWYHQKTTY